MGIITKRREYPRGLVTSIAIEDFFATFTDEILANSKQILDRFVEEDALIRERTSKLLRIPSKREMHRARVSATKETT